jgi:hypothetical protein
MSNVEVWVDSGLMPDSNWHPDDEIDRLERPQIVEASTVRVFAPRAAFSEEASRRE